MKCIKSIHIYFFILVLLTVVTGCQTAQESPHENVGPRAVKSSTDTVTKGCETELKTYCSNVALGKGRRTACLYGHNDKLSEECGNALSKSAAELQQFHYGVGYASSECKKDIQEHCSDAIPGEGRILNCLMDEKHDVVSKRCNQAIKETGLDLEYMELPH